MLDNTTNVLGAAELDRVSGGVGGGIFPDMWPTFPPGPGLPSVPPPFPDPFPAPPEPLPVPEYGFKIPRF